MTVTAWTQRRACCFCLSWINCVFMGAFIAGLLPLNARKSIYSLNTQPYPIPIFLGMYWLPIGYTQMIPTQYMMKWLGTGRQSFIRNQLWPVWLHIRKYNYSNGLGLNSHSKGNQPNMFCLGQDPCSHPSTYSNLPHRVRPIHLSTSNPIPTSSSTSPFLLLLSSTTFLLNLQPRRWGIGLMSTATPSLETTIASRLTGESMVALPERFCNRSSLRWLFCVQNVNEHQLFVPHK